MIGRSTPFRIQFAYMRLVSLYGKPWETRYRRLWPTVFGSILWFENRKKGVAYLRKWMSDRDRNYLLRLLVYPYCVFEGTFRDFSSFSNEIYIGDRIDPSCRFCLLFKQPTFYIYSFKRFSLKRLNLEFPLKKEKNERWDCKLSSAQIFFNRSYFCTSRYTYYWLLSSKTLGISH